jgi:hypothetical protein
MGKKWEEKNIHTNLFGFDSLCVFSTEGQMCLRGRECEIVHKETIEEEEEQEEQEQEQEQEEEKSR